MQIKNTKDGYGIVSIAFHWLSAIAVIGLFALGLWMEGLSYYDEWYKKAPELHKGIGFFVILAIIARLIWKLSNPLPQPPETHKSWEKLLAKVVHWVFYVLLILMLPTGYLVTTAKGQSLEIFNWFAIPATITGVENLEDIAIEIHEMIAFTIVWIAGFHALAALKHHFIDKDSTLKRMLGRR